MEVFRVLALVLSGLVAILYFYQTVYLFLPRLRRPAQIPPLRTARGRYAVLTAARNEETVLPYLLDSIRVQAYPEELIDVYVAADNCTDGTAAAARRLGATVYERRDLRRVGKGYALAFLIDHIRRSGRLEDYDAFLVFDADNLLEPDYIAAMDRTFAQGFEAVCGYRGAKNFMNNWLTAGYGLWYAHDSAHFNASRMALGVTCLVTGTGFGFTKKLLDRWGRRWPFLSLTEDMEFDTWCAVNGVRVGYCPGAMLYDEQCAGFAQSWRQRTRWIQGSIQLSRRYAGSLVRGLLRGGTWRERYSCFENMTVNVYGYVLCALSAALGMAAAAMGGCGPVRAVALPLLWMYVNMFFLGAVTCVQERRTIPGGFWRKVWACLTFPLFLMTFVPIGAWAFIARPQWKPIAHTAALSISDMDRPGLTAGRADVTKV